MMTKLTLTALACAVVATSGCSSDGTGTATGGTSGSAGSSGSGGSSGSSGGGGVSPGSVTLVLEVAAGTSYCVEGGCGIPSTIAIKDMSGTFVARSPGDCYTPCGTCEQLPCPGAACILQGYAVTGETVTWDGTRWMSGTCGSGTSCLEKTFAPAGQYVAVMCATPGALETPDGGEAPQCVGTAETECVEVPFQFPSSEIYKGTLGS